MPVPVPTPVLGPGATAISWLWDIFWPATIVIIFIRQLLRENTFEALGALLLKLNRTTDPVGPTSQAQRQA